MKALCICVVAIQQAAALLVLSSCCKWKYCWCCGDTAVGNIVGIVEVLQVEAMLVL